ncbi:MAG TPA: hypothetical protein VHL80_04460 [Polyangia bacterium]|nr:hypothetical protein [Polyangia bacterium]
MVPTVWPDWWEWELRLTRHLEVRMEQRGLPEDGLREIMEAATGFSPAVEEGRFAVFGYRRGRLWKLIVEPDPDGRVLVAVTVFGEE